jgi:exodeoxyribonuclease VII large subunit
VAEAVALAGKGVRLAAPGSLWVQGEVSGLVKSRAGHWYWSLSGDGVRLPARALRREATAIGEVLRAAGVVLADGLTVRVFGTLGVFAARGQVQLQVSAIDPAVSVGAGVLARRQVRARLAAAGLMGRQRQLRTNVCPLRVGVVAPAGQGLADFVGVLQASPWAWRVRVVTVASEGPAAPAGIAGAIADLARADLVVVARGGGAGVTAAYDTYEVAAAVCTSAVPVVMAVGHHDDASVADTCAFRSVSTPTAAGEFCCELLRAADAQVAAIGRQVVDAGRHRLETAARDVAAVESAIAAERGRLLAARAHAARLAAARSARRARWAVVAAAVLAVIVLFLILAR